jgi:microcystin-dependent protein
VGELGRRLVELERQLAFGGGSFTGQVAAAARDIPPNGWLLCDGTAVSRTTYSRLFSAITLTKTGATFATGQKNVTVASTADLTAGMPVSGTGIGAGNSVASITSGTVFVLTNNTTAASGAGGNTLTFAPYGVGDGSTTFNLPDLRGRVPVGEDSAGVRINVANGRDLGESGGAQTHALTETEHSFRRTSHEAGGYGLSGSVNFTDRVGVYSGGNGGAHNNMQPYQVLNYFIRT